MHRLFLFVLLSLFYSVTAIAGELRLAVAANFTDVSRELISLFEKQSAHRVKASYGSTGKLYAQIINGAPFELFLAADSERPARLEEEGMAVAGSRFIYASGKLVLWSADATLFNDGEQFLQDGDYRRLALANPNTAPYGEAARQVLQRLGLWQQLQGRMVFGDSISQTFQFTATGNAQLGFVAASQAKAWPRTVSLWAIPDDYYQPIAQQAVLLKRGEKSAAAIAFVEFLKSEAVKQRIRDHGYAVE
jgi:molybdate transport system substrate-binding protein